MPITVKNCTRLGMNYAHLRFGYDFSKPQHARGYIASGISMVMISTAYSKSIVKLTVIQEI